MTTNTPSMTRSLASLRARCLACVTSVAMAATLVTAPAYAHNHTNPSAASSALSLLPVALSVAVPAGLLSAGAVLTVVAVEASAQGTVWLLERASDGVQMSVNIAGNASLAVGALVTVTVLSTGWVLSQAGRAVLYVPNEAGALLLYNERVTR